MKKIKLDLDNLERNICFENEYGIGYGDIFIMNYQGINVFFFVCRSLAEQVCVYELAKKKRRFGNLKVNKLCPGLKPTQSPNVITQNNCGYKSNFWVPILDKDNIIIPITKEMPIAYKTGCLYDTFCIATKIPEEEKANGVLNYYWDIY